MGRYAGRTSTWGAPLRWLVVLAVLVAAWLAASAVGAAPATDPPGDAARTAAPSAAGDDGGSDAAADVVVRYFYGDGCPYCAEQAEHLDAWEDELDVEVHRYEVWGDEDNRALYAELAEAHGVEPRAVPATFIGPWVWLGFSPELGAEMRSAIATCAVEGCDDPMAALDAASDPDQASPPDAAVDQDADPDSDADLGAATDPRGDATPGARSTVTIPLIGTVELAGGGVVASTALIAFVDGFNPCSLWVLSVLLALLVRTGSRRRLAAVGVVFLTVTAGIYGLFIAGAFGTMSYVGHLGWIRGVVALFALTFAAVNIKDYVALKKGPSFTIPDRFKPNIYRGGRRVAFADGTLPAVLGATVVMAAGVALVELPCTAGFPVVWSGIVTDAGVSGATFGSLLALYLGVYLLIEIAVVVAVVTTMNVSKIQEDQVQLLKLVGGTVMLALGVVILAAPDVLHSIGGTLVVFVSAVGLAAAIHLGRRLAVR